MNAAALSARHRALKWLAPAGVLGVVGLAASGVFDTKAASQELPRTSAASLIAQVQNSRVDGFSGTVVSTFALGLPDLPSFGGSGAGDASTLSSLLIGSHTVQVWYGGVEQQRVALLGSTDETDLFRNGSDLWEWSSAARTAVHTTMSAGQRSPIATVVPSGTPSLPQALASFTPEQLARRVLRLLDATTSVRIEHEHDIADRSSYQLVLIPRSAATLIGAVHISIDGRTKVPLGVQIYARGASAPAIDVGFTSIRFARQSARNFAFTPPPGARVQTVNAAGVRSAVTALPATAHRADPVHQQAAVVGRGWTRVLVTRMTPSGMRNSAVAGVLRESTTVTGSWGRGRLVQTPLLNVLLGSDGRVFAGSVEPSALFAAAGTK